MERKWNMRFIIAPAKKMNVDTDTLAPEGLPVYLEQAEELAAWLAGMSFEEQKKLWRCNDGIARLNRERLERMDLRHNLTPAVLAYEGIQYQYMAPAVFETEQWAYIQEHVRILSGFYGILKPLDGVTPYRLEMQTKGAPRKGSSEDAGRDAHGRDLYDYWGRRLYEALKKETDCIVNLASKEYSLCVERYLEPEMRYITCVFGEEKDGRIIQKGTYAKMARGEMVRFAAERGIEDPEELKTFDRLGYTFREEYSGKDEFVFVAGVDTKGAVD